MAGADGSGGAVVIMHAAQSIVAKEPSCLNDQAGARHEVTDLST
jgi:hypothetical protein